MIDLTSEQMADFETLYNYLRVETSLPDRADAIIAGGSGTLTDMADRAVELYREGRAPLIIFSGFSHPDFQVGEAEMLASIAIESGVPRDVIATETKATNTGLNIILSAKILTEKGIKANKIILVHKPYMTRRFIATAEAQWPEPKPIFYVTCASMNFSEYYNYATELGLVDSFLGSMLKYYDSVLTSPSLGYQTIQSFDVRTDEAVKRLLRQGFSARRKIDSLATDEFSA